MAVIGISGGKDSALTAKLLTDALGKERVFGVMLPNGIQSDIEDSRKVCDFLGIKHATINIEDAYKGLTDRMQEKFSEENFNYSNYKTNTIIIIDIYFFSFKFILPQKTICLSYKYSKIKLRSIFNIVTKYSFHISSSTK